MVTDPPLSRSLELLRRHLSPHQQRTLNKYGFIYVKCKKGNVYALFDGWRFWGLSRDGTPRREYHAGPRSNDGYQPPIGDGILVQMLLLQISPNKLIDEACSTSLSGLSGESYRAGTPQYQVLTDHSEFKAFMEQNPRPFRPRLKPPAPRQPAHMVAPLPRFPARSDWPRNGGLWG